MRNAYKQNSRAVAFELLLAVEVDGAYANLHLPKLLSQAKLEQRDSALAQELAFGTLRNQLFYDKVIEVGAKRAIDEIDIRALTLLRLGCHQLLSLRTPSHAAINETVNLAKQVSSQGSAGFVNGILRRVSERTIEQWRELLLADTTDRVAKLEIEYSHPAWIIRSLEQALRIDGRADTLEDLLGVDNEAPEVNIVALPGFADEAETASMQAGPASPIGFVMNSGDPGKLVGMRDGGLRVQDQGSQLAALALTNATPISDHESWLDMCAGPGGKAALLAALAKQTNARLQANEISEHRAKLVSQALSKVDRNVDVFCADARTIGEDAPESFDRILLDAPCTGLGALRRRPESRWRKKPSDIAELTKLQQELIESAWLSLKKGGVLAYVTCSPHSGETVAIVDWLQKRYGEEVRLIDAPATLLTLNPSLELNRQRKTAQLWPHINKTDAMFIALITKSVG
jgi:16S rRNA (cytosine967-C5)-methyltransferase